VPALSTIDRASGRARAVLFRVVPRAANRARPIWNTIVVGYDPNAQYNIFHNLTKLYYFLSQNCILVFFCPYLARFLKLLS
jgi:hypothetical protein